MRKDPIDEVVVFLGVTLSQQLLMGVTQVNMGASEVRQSMLELRAVSALDWVSGGRDVAGVEPTLISTTAGVHQDLNLWIPTGRGCSSQTASPFL